MKAPNIRKEISALRLMSALLKAIEFEVANKVNEKKRIDVEKEITNNSIIRETV